MHQARQEWDHPIKPMEIIEVNINGGGPAEDDKSSSEIEILSLLLGPSSQLVIIYPRFPSFSHATYKFLFQRLQSQRQRRMSGTIHLYHWVCSSSRSRSHLPPKWDPRKSLTCMLFPPMYLFVCSYWPFVVHICMVAQPAILTSPCKELEVKKTKSSSKSMPKITSFFKSFPHFQIAVFRSLRQLTTDQQQTDKPTMTDKETTTANKPTMTDQQGDNVDWLTDKAMMTDGQDDDDRWWDDDWPMTTDEATMTNNKMTRTDWQGNNDWWQDNDQLMRRQQPRQPTDKEATTKITDWQQGDNNWLTRWQQQTNKETMTNWQGGDDWWGGNNQDDWLTRRQQQQTDKATMTDWQGDNDRLTRWQWQTDKVMTTDWQGNNNRPTRRQWLTNKEVTTNQQADKQMTTNWWGGNDQPTSWQQQTDKPTTTDKETMTTDEPTTTDWWEDDDQLTRRQRLTDKAMLTDQQLTDDNQQLWTMMDNDDWQGQTEDRQQMIWYRLD